MEEVKEAHDKYNLFILNQQNNDSFEDKKLMFQLFLKHIENDIKCIEDEDYDMYCFYKYLIANQSIKYLNLNENQKKIFLYHLKTYKVSVIKKIKNTEIELNQLSSQLPTNNQLIQQCQNKLKAEVELIKNEDKSLYDKYQKLMSERFDDKSVKIKKILNDIIELISYSSFQEDFQKQILQALKLLEERIIILEEEEEEEEQEGFDRYGYYCFLLAYYIQENQNLNSKNAENCENIKKKYLDNILNKIEKIYNNILNITSKQSIDQANFQKYLNSLQIEIQFLEKENFQKFGYYKYIIAENKLSYLKLNEKQKKKCEQEKKIFMDYYEQQLSLKSKENFQNENLKTRNIDLNIINQKQIQYNQLDQSTPTLDVNLSQHQNQEQKQEEEARNQNINTSNISSQNSQYSQIQSQIQIQSNHLFQKQTTVQQSISSSDNLDISSLSENESVILSQFQYYEQEYKQKLEEGNENINTSNISSQIPQYSKIQNQIQVLSNQASQKQTTMQQSIYISQTLGISNLQQDESSIQSQLFLSNQILNKSIYENQIQEKEKWKNQILFEFSKNNTVANINTIISQSQKDAFETQKVYLIMGETGVGKSSFVQYLTGDPRAEIGHLGNSHTQKCRTFKKNELKFIDSPGINDTQDDRYQILLNIVKYLKQYKYRFQDLFIICVSNKDINNHLKHIQEFSYTYFLYDLFGDQIKFKDVEQLVDEYFQSTCLLNWQEAGFHYLQDQYTGKRVEIFKKKDQALNYIQYAQNLHIVVKTCFDKTHQENLKIFNNYKVDFLKQQIWSNKKENINDLLAYKEYIQSQEVHLFNKIKKIIQFWDEVQIWNQGEQIQHLLLIGGSQVGKSSLIEQLKQISGLRGSGTTSITSFCQIFLVEYNKVKYFFIDTPGFEGTEANQNQYHNLKIISDFLRRNRITEFKVLYMRDAERDVRDGMPQVLNKLFFFIQEMFDQDSSFIDSLYLRELMTFQFSQTNNQSDYIKYQLNLIEKKILTIERVEKRNNKGLVYMNKFNKQSVEFQSNFFTEYGKFIQVDIIEDDLQKKTLFEGVNQIEPICVDEKIFMKIKKTINSKIINNLDDYMTAFKKVLELYQQYNNIFNLINIGRQNKQNISKDLNDQRIKIAEKLSNIIYIVIGDFQNTPEMKNYISKLFLNKISSNNEQNHQNELNNKVLNSIQKHFLKASYTPFLFEAQQNPNNIFLSRKQLYYSSLAHQLSPFLRKSRPDHQKIIEKLSIIKILQELTFQSHVQSKQIELEINSAPEKIIDKIDAFISGINNIFGSGGQFFRQFYLINNVVEDIFKFKQVFNVAAKWQNYFLSTISFGFDAYSYSKGKICRRQMELMTYFNIANTILPYCLSVSGIGWLGLFALGFIAERYLTQSFTSSQIFDKTLGLVLKTIIDDQHPNQVLLYFQKSEFLKQHKITNYSQTQSKEAYEMFRQLEEKNYKSGEQNKFLLKLFNQSEQPKRLKDEISKHIVKNIISKHFQFEFEQIQGQNLIQGIEKQLKSNKQIIDTFYQRFNFNNLLKNIKQDQKKLKETLHQNEKQTNICLHDDTDFLQKLNTYQQSLNVFIKHIENTSYNYKEQKEFCEKIPLSKCQYYPITFKGYCNLVHQKSQYIFMQDTISEIFKNNNCFEVKPENNFNHEFFQFQNDDELTYYLNLLILSDKFITSRYILKVKGNKQPYLSFMNGTEVIDAEVEYSIDLFQKANESFNLKDFVEIIKIETKNQFNIDKEIYLRLKNFFESIGNLKQIFG
ncbi:50S ribosome-binding GTPase (macronuclear) [Tetrahymena thermophila SB210]|uniref:50S ribosome-binding GTPase n=1 Tax=Tetrahymena thermophila (strain SB210) TaxID=312017 RepID=Q22WH9_TETTS|nr:50S ribosome-binding GTPase [Tetrahymena thermophila SB210]EAR89438.2 50S ribosome-binding GTPase [Tetrahymena thermophila SB210]|eukprot:XP_001009683.2 50S ribosome-binding GTPase [Tetrahymena thermophila SB210]